MRKFAGRVSPFRVRALILGFAALLAPAPGVAAIFENLYTVTVPLAPRGVRRQALRTDADFDRFAMGELLIRLTGRLDAPANPALADLVRDAGRYVVQRGNPDRENLLIVFDPLGLQEALTETAGFAGIIGSISCDGFGDCGTGRIHISHYTDPSVGDIAEVPVVFRYEP